MSSSSISSPSSSSSSSPPTNTTSIINSIVKIDEYATPFNMHIPPMKTLVKLKNYLNHIFRLGRSPRKVTEIYYGHPLPSLASNRGLFEDCDHEYKLVKNNADVKEIFLLEEAGARPIYLDVKSA